MPSKNPRLSVVLTPALASTLASLSHETGDSASSLVRGFLEQAEPALARMLELVRAAKSAKGQIGAGVAGAMDRLVDDLEDVMAVADSRVGRISRDLVSQAQAVEGRRRGGGGRAAHGAAPVSTPVPVTRGSGTGKTRIPGDRKGARRGSL